MATAYLAGTLATVRWWPFTMATARSLQARIEEFNKARYRLELPLQMRIGLHVGEIAGPLDDVVCSRVIVVAAHVEASAPVGGIALTEPVAERLLQAKLKDSPAVADGYRIMVEHTDAPSRERRAPSPEVGKLLNLGWSSTV